jgi:hypothetical protein
MERVDGRPTGERQASAPPKGRTVSYNRFLRRRQAVAARYRARFGSRPYKTGPLKTVQTLGAAGHNELGSKLLFVWLILRESDPDLRLSYVSASHLQDSELELTSE